MKAPIWNRYRRSIKGSLQEVYKVKSISGNFVILDCGVFETVEEVKVGDLVSLVVRRNLKDADGPLTYCLKAKLL